MTEPFPSLVRQESMAARLRAATRTAHEDIETVPALVRLLTADLTEADYIAVLRQTCAFHLGVEQQLKAVLAPEFGARGVPRWHPDFCAGGRPGLVRCPSPRPCPSPRHCRCCPIRRMRWGRCTSSRVQVWVDASSPDGCLTRSGSHRGPGVAFTAAMTLPRRATAGCGSATCCRTLLPGRTQLPRTWPEAPSQPSAASTPGCGGPR